MVAAPPDSTDMIDYCLKGSLTNLESWGHEYLRALSGHLGFQYNKKVEADEATTEILGLVDIIVP